MESQANEMGGMNQIQKFVGKFFLLEDDEDGFPQPILEIEEEEYLMLIEISKELYRFRYFQRKILEIQLNYDDYFRLKESYEKMLFEIDNEIEVNDTIDFAFVDINRVFINFISSLKTFLEHFEMRLKKKYGKDSKDVKEFKKFNSSNYDSMFAHRLFVNLRNYSQHDDYPINHVEFDLEYKDNKAVRGRLITDFNKEKILNSAFGKKLEVDLLLMNYQFPVDPQMKEIQKFINQLLSKIIEIEFYKLKDPAKITMMYLSRTYKKREAKIGYVTVDANKGIWHQTRLEVVSSNFLLGKLAELGVE